MPLLVKGDLVRIALENGGLIALPNDWGLVHDTDGEVIRRCTVLILPYAQSANTDADLSRAELVSARNYFGKRTRVTRVFVEIPPPSWHRLPDAVEIFYARSGKHAGRRGHKFEVPVPLFAHAFNDAYQLELPDFCVLDDRGFVWP